MRIISFSSFCIFMSLCVIAFAQQVSPIVAVNQSGYNLHLPKRFTAPGLNNAPYSITRHNDSKTLYKGTVQKGIGDFSDFRPEGSSEEYQIHVVTPGHGTLHSDPFGIASFWLEKAFLRPALEFMIDNRSVTGTHPSAYGGSPWRDGTYYAFEVPSLVMQWMALAPLYRQLPPTISYTADQQRILNPGFKYIAAPGDRDALRSTRKYFTELDGPVGQTVPDIIQLIHWGIGYYLVNPATADPSGDPLGYRIHPQTIEQLAFFLYAYPSMKEFLTPAFYEKVHATAFEQWEKTGLFEPFRVVGTLKGRECPGHSILPNLLMYEVARRENRPDADRFMKAAYAQTKWVLDSVDFNNPRTTKGQRMSEHKLMTGLVYFYQQYPQKAPKMLKNKINQWVDVVLSRSDNMWDFRRYDDSLWTIPRHGDGLATTHAGWNEPGNLAGFPACALAAASVVTDVRKRKRLEELAWAAQDNLFGRNPLNVSSPAHPNLGFTGLERGWPKHFKDDVCARLELVRGGLSSSVPTEMYPYQPSEDFRHPEGWTAFNASWNVGLAYMSAYQTRLEWRSDNTLELTAPLGVYDDQITVPVEITRPNGSRETITLRTTAKDKSVLTAVLTPASIRQGGVVSFGQGPFVKRLKLRTPKNNQ